MSIPTSETRPDGLSKHPPARRRNVRYLLENASQQEISDYLRDLKHSSHLDAGYLLQLLVCLVVLFFALTLDSTLLLFVAMVVAPTLTPMLGLAIAPTLPSVAHGLKSLLGILATIGAFMGTGFLAKASGLGLAATSNLPDAFLLRNTWVEWAALLIAVGFFSYRFVYQNFPSRLASALISLLVFIPSALAGWQLKADVSDIWAVILSVSGLRLLVAQLVMMMTFWISGFPPRKLTGWLILLVILSGVAVIAWESGNHLGRLPRGGNSEYIAVVTATPGPNTPTVKALAPVLIDTPTMTPPQTRTAIPEPTRTATPEPTATLTPTLTPTPVILRVIADNGLVMREFPDGNALILAYINYGEYVVLLGEQQTWGSYVWEKVIAPNGETGWVPNNWLVTVTPAN